MRLLIIENGLIGRFGHHYNMTLGFLREARRRGIETRVYVNTRTEADITSAVDGRPAFKFTPYERLSADPLSGPLEDLIAIGSRFAADCAALAEDGMTGGDVVFVPSAQQNELHGLTLWLETRPKDEIPTIFANFANDNFMSPNPRRVNFTAALYRFAARRLAAVVPDDRLFFTAHSDAMAQLFADLMLRQVRTYPLPMYYDFAGSEADNAKADDAEDSNARDGLLISVQGHSRSEKGFAFVPDVIRLCNTAGLPVRFFVQVAPKEAADGLGDAFAELQNTDNVELHLGALSEDDYMARIRRSDIVLLPYIPEQYVVKASAVFAEAVALGKVTVVSPGGWMAAQLEAGRGAGTIFKDLEAASMVDAISEAVERFSSLDAEARARAPAWRDLHSVAGYLDRLLSELAV